MEKWLDMPVRYASPAGALKNPDQQSNVEEFTVHGGIT